MTDTPPRLCHGCGRPKHPRQKRCYVCHPGGRGKARIRKVGGSPSRAPMIVAPMVKPWHYEEPAPTEAELARQVMSWLAWHRDSWAGAERVMAGTKGTLRDVRACLEALAAAGRVESRPVNRNRGQKCWIPAPTGNFDRILYRIRTAPPPDEPAGSPGPPSRGGRPAGGRRSTG